MDDQIGCVYGPPPVRDDKENGLPVVRKPTTQSGKFSKLVIVLLIMAIVIAVVVWLAL